MKIKEGYFKVSHEINSLPLAEKEKFLKDELEYRGWDEIIFTKLEKDLVVYTWRKYIAEGGSDEG